MSTKVTWITESASWLYQVQLLTVGVPDQFGYVANISVAWLIRTPTSGFESLRINSLGHWGWFLIILFSSKFSTELPSLSDTPCLSVSSRMTSFLLSLPILYSSPLDFSLFSSYYLFLTPRLLPSPMSSQVFQYLLQIVTLPFRCDPISWNTLTAV